MSSPEEPADVNLDEADIDPPEMEEPEEEAVGDTERPIENVVNDIRKLEERVKHYQGEAVLASERGDDETLSTTLMRLARVNSALGKHAAYVNYIARNADRAARRHRATITLDEAKSQAVNKSELKAEIASKEEFANASYAQLIADQASDLCFRTDTFLKMAQSRLSLIKGDKHRA